MGETTVGGFRSVIAACAAIASVAVGPFAASASGSASASGAGPVSLSTPTPAATSNSVLSGVSCPTDDHCVAVGSAQTHGYHRTALVENWDGTRWSIAAAGLFADLKPASLESVSCAAANRCVAVGYATTANATGTHGQITRPIAARELAGHWRPDRPVTRTPGLVITRLGRVSCPAGSECEAIGDGFEKGGSVTVVERLHSGRWTVTATSRLPGARRTSPGDIGCSSVSSCLITEDGIVVGPHETHALLGVMRLTPVGWRTVISRPGPGLVTSNVTCPADGPCLAFAHAVPSPTLDEVSPTGAISPLPVPAESGTQAVVIDGLTCPALDHCFGLGAPPAPVVSPTHTRTTSVAETYDGTAFAPAFAGLPLRLDGLTCRLSFCMLVGSHARTAASPLNGDGPTRRRT